ncbi:MAG: 30S ribosome-binding factor RbfA [Candidatus Eisenbacteria sp.]|nr:30S ribosome-binding factor RbfA [Candidatus Eisenbacteria bacterium]
MVGSYRLEKVNVQIQREISDILFRKVKDPRIGFVSVTGVKVSKDYDVAVVYVSLFGEPDGREASWKGLAKARSFIRAELGKRIRLRKTPDIIFRLDDSIESGARIEEELRSLDVSGEGGDSVGG